MTSRDFATSAQAHTSSTEDDTSVHPSHSHREVGLDIVRGLAVLGTFATNVWLFTHPGGLFGSLFDPLAGIDSSADLFVYGIAAGLPNGKFLALLMMVFGMGVTIQFAAWNRRNPPTSEPTTGDRARRRAWLRTYTPRALVLLIDGTVNFVLVAEFDILMGYAFTGVVVAALISGSPRTARVWAWCAGTLHVCGLLLLAGLLLAPAGPDPSSPRTNGRNQETPPAVDETAARRRPRPPRSTRTAASSTSPSSGWTTRSSSVPNRCLPSLWGSACSSWAPASTTAGSSAPPDAPCASAS